jgi:predicted transcriptional regulator
MFELPDSDPLLQGSKSAIDTIDKIEKGLSDLTKRLDAQDDFLKRANAMLDEVQAANARRAKDAAVVKEFYATGHTPAAVLMRRAKKGHAL